jgi:RHS repeat-associated protein
MNFSNPRSRIAYAVVFVLGLVLPAEAQISGSNPVTVGATVTYTYNDGIMYNRRNWQITNGTIVSSTFSGTSNSCTVTWSSTCGTGTLTFRNLNTVISTLNVTINATLATPTGTITTTQFCRYTTLTRSGTPPAGETWYWQTSASGTSTTYSGSTFDITASGFYYLRAYACGAWSAGALNAGHIAGPINPTAPAANSGVRCGPGSVLLTATPGSQGDNIRWYDASSGGTLLHTGTSYTTPSISGLTYYYAATLHTATNCESLSRTLVTASINPVPDASASGQTVCSGQATSISITNPNGVSGTTFSWTASASGVSGASNGSGSSISQTLTTTAQATGTVTYTITPSANGCSGTPVNATVTVYALGTPTGTFSTTSNCQSVDITRNSSPPPGITWYWQTSSTGISTANSNATYNVTASGYYYLRAYGCGTWSASALSTAYISVPVLPGAPASVTGASRCGTGTVTLSATIGSGGNGIRWYAVASGGSALATGTSYVTPSISATTTYFAATYITATGCEGPRSAVTATINAVPGNASSPVSTPSAVYGTQSVTLNASGAQSGETYAWYTVSSGGSAVSSTQSVSTNSTFYVSRKVTATGCESATRVSVTVPAYAIATITPSATQYVAYGSFANLSANGGYFNYQWKLDGSDIAGATGQTHAAKRPGVYTVAVKGSSTAPLHTSPSGVTVSGVMSQSLNMVSETRLFKEGLTLTSVIDTLSRDKLSQSITYMDGMGRPFQSVAVAASPDQYDLVSASGPEKQGLAIIAYLPYVSTANDGRYRQYALRGANGTYTASEQYGFYQNASQVAHDTKPYSKTVYRQTPDARAIESGAPGTHWQPDSAHTVRSQIAFNQTSDSVRKWTSLGAGNGYYAANTVVVETTTDENGNQVKTFVNALGQTVLKKVQYDATKWLKTYYVYDDYGRLKYQVPPRAVGLLDATPDLVADTNLAELIYRYDYDNRDRVTVRKVPGATQEEHIVYDKLDRVVLTQDGNLRGLGKWMFIKYDYYGRPAYSGLFASTDTRATLQTALNNEDYTQSGIKWYETEAAGDNDYSNQAYPRTGTTVLTVNYYDHYDFNRNGSADYSFDGSHLTGQETTAQAAVRGSATGSRRQTLDAAGNVTGTWLKSVVFYGAYDRVIQTLSNNHLYATLADKTTVIYNFAGQVVKSKTTHTGSASFSVSFVDRPVYDHAGRVVKQYRKIDAAAEQLLAEYVYNKLGQVVDKKLHDTGGGAFLQSVDFRYNIRGWLTSINNAKLSNDGTLNNDTGDYFGLELAYQSGIAGMGVAKQYNGNVSAVKWKSFGIASGDADQRSFKFSYDKSDRLTAATFQASSNATTWNREVNTLNETLTYDANGNLKTLVRKRNSRGLSGSTVTSSAQTIDDLNYIYQSVNGGTQNSNVLARVNEAVTGTVGEAGFKNGDNSDTEFTYTTWGSASKDMNKGISAIDYNFLGKVRSVTYTSGKKIEYTYDVAGTKLTVKTLQGTTVESLTTYVGGFVYEGTTPALSFFASPEGRVVKNGSAYEYQYSISDHQGNTRIVFSSVTPSASTLTATFEGTGGDQSGSFSNVNGTHVVPFTPANQTSGGSKVVRMNQGYAVGPAKSVKVYPGDSVKVEVWAYYEATSGYGTNGVALVTAIAAAFGGASGAGGESGSIFDGVNSALGGFAAGGSPDDEEPPAYLNYILFDQQYKVLDAGWQRVPTSANFSRQKVTLPAKYIAEAGYYFTYLSYEGESNNYVYFDDYKVRHVKSNLIQGNEYYPFGMQTANSWTRENTTANNYLANGGTELNQTSQLYDLYYRNYDPALGRMFQIDPMASKYGSLTPYNYSLNNPTNLNDPLGDDVEPQPPYPREYQCAMCWREGENRALYMMVSGGGGFSGQWSYRQSGINSANSYWHNGVMDWKRGLKEDAEAVKNGGMSYADYGAKYGATIYEKGGGIEWTSEIFNPWMGAEISRTADNTITYAGGWMKMDFGIMAKLMIKGYQVNLRNVGRVNRFYADGGQTQGGGPGDEYSSFEKALIFINEFNPVANAWDALSGYINGTDRFGNPISKRGATWEAASVIPWGRVIGGVGKVGTQFMKYQGNFVLNSSWKNWGTYMSKQGWSFQQVEQTLMKGNWQPWTKNQNWLNPGNSMSIVTNPQTGQSLIIDNVTKEIIQLGKVGHSF